MSSEARGVYIMLLADEWINGPLPNDHVALAKICFESVRTVDRVWPMVSVKFVPHPDDPTRLINPRLEHEREEQVNRRAEMSEAGKKGAKKRWGPHRGGHKGGNSLQSASASARQVLGAHAPQNGHVPQGPVPCPTCGKTDCPDPFDCRGAA